MFKKLLTVVLSCLMAVTIIAMTACNKTDEALQQSKTQSNSQSNSQSSTEHTHVYGNWEITKPTETQQGSATKVCADCPAESEKQITVTLPVLTDSSYTLSEDTATCTESGTVTYKFSYEQEQIEFQIISQAKGHNLGEWNEAVEPTANSEGKKGYYCCSTCKQYFDAEKKLIVDGELVVPMLWSSDENSHWHGDNKADLAQHVWNDGIITKPSSVLEEGVMSYECTVCAAKKTEAIAKVEVIDAGVLTQDTQFTFDTAESNILQKKLADGIKVVATAEKPVSVVASSKSKDQISFTHTLKLGGKINADSRYIEINVDKACSVKVYALSADSTAERKLNIYQSLENIQESGIYQSQTVASGNTLSVATFQLTQPGTYYLGSESGGINIYGIFVTIATEVHEFDTAWSSDDNYHYHVCQNQGCNEVSEKALHTFDDGVITVQPTQTASGEKTYTCTVCSKVKVVEIPSLSTEEPIVITFNGDDVGTLTTEKQLATGVKVVATANKSVVIEANAKSSSNGKQFTHRLKLGGKINPDSRYIEITADAPCTIKVYAMSATLNTTRNLNIYQTVTSDATVGALLTQSVNADGLVEVEYQINEAGTYYLGSESGGINIYGIEIIK